MALSLAMLGILLVALIAGAMIIATVVKAIVWLVLLPFRILFGLLFSVLLLPLLLLKALVIGILLVAVGPIVVLSILGAALATVLALAVPLFPLLCIGFVVWLVMRSADRPSPSASA
jgi:hypothetical protein